MHSRNRCSQCCSLLLCPVPALQLLPLRFPQPSSLLLPMSSAPPSPSLSDSLDDISFRSDADITAAQDRTVAEPAALPPPSQLLPVIAALGASFDLQFAQLQQVEDEAKLKFAQTLPDHLNPVLLMTRLQALSASLPALAERQARLTAEKTEVHEEVQRLLDQNRALILDMHGRMGMPPSDELVKPSALLNSRPHTAPLSPMVLPSSSPASASSSTAAPSNKRKSVRPSTAHAAPPSPSLSEHEAILEQIEEQGPVSEKELAGVSTTVKSRVKLAEVNALFLIIQTHFARLMHGNSGGGKGSLKKHNAENERDVATLPPLTLTQLAELGAATNMKVGGATSQCIIGTLRACKRIIVDRRGILLVKPPPPISALVPQR